MDYFCFGSQDERTALHIASQEGHDHVVELLLQAGASVDQEAKVRSRKYCNGGEQITLYKIKLHINHNPRIEEHKQAVRQAASSHGRNACAGTLYRLV